MNLPQKSIFLEFFKQNAERLHKDSQLIGDILIIEKIIFPEAKVGGIILASSNPLHNHRDFTAEQPGFYRVLMVGQGYYDEKGEDIPLEVKPGNIIMTGTMSVKLFTVFPMLEITDTHMLGMTRYSDVQWKWETEEEFYKFLGDFNQSVKAEVSARRENRN